MLRDEINNIALRIVKVREAKNNMKYNTESGSVDGAWRVPKIESMDRKFGEEARYFLMPHQRTQGVKYVPPPVHDHIYQLRQDSENYERT